MSTIDAPARVAGIRRVSFGDEMLSNAKPISKSAAIWNIAVFSVALCSNGALLVAQQIAFRLLAPLIGSSLETWSAIISVFLLGIAIGNGVAGKLSDRFSSLALMTGGLFAGAISLLLMPFIANGLGTSLYFGSLPLKVQICLAATLVCLLPGILLSFVTPPSIRSLVKDANDVGRVSGRIFAWGTLGSLIGNYLTGFVLIAFLGVQSIVLICSGSLVALTVLLLIARRYQPSFNLMHPSVSAADNVRSQQSIASDTNACDPAWYRLALFIVIACSFSSGALEGAAFRILAPLVGVSMFLSAGVIGVILAGMALGNFLGGHLATRHGSHAMLEKSLLACAAGTLAVAPFWKICVSTEVFQSMPLIAQIIAWSFTLFFLPALALGTITPQVIRLSVTDVRRAAAIAGHLYAWSTVGCIAGILSASWFLIETLGAIRTSLFCGIVPIVLIGMLRIVSKKSSNSEYRMMAPALVVTAIILFCVCKSPYDRESRYFSLAVTDDVIDQREVKMLVLDRLVHSAIDLKDPSFLHYPHERIQGDLTRSAAAEARSHQRTPRVLIIGGGGYSFPRWIESQPDLSDVEIDVVEIDPAVTEIAYDQLGLSRATRIVSINMDGRQFVKSAPAVSYDLVIQDAVNDFSVPYHLLTAEYNSLISRLLRPDGAYLLTVIDAMESARFLTSAVRTMQSSFADTRLLAPKETVMISGRSVFVIAGRPLDHDLAQQGAEDSVAWWNHRTTAHVYPKHQVEQMLTRGKLTSSVLTDDYAPVDFLMTSHFLDSVK